MRVVPSFGFGTLRPFYGDVIADGAHTIYSDQAWDEWVLPGDVHTNTIEGVWALLKRSIAGSYHKLSEKHLQTCLDEMTWRHNNRENAYLFRDLLRAERLEYKALTA